MSNIVNIGDRLPSFKVKDAEGEVVTDEDLIGSPFLLYFYPKNDTPGCIKEACGFRDVMDSFDDMDILVVGVSGDSPDSHKKFAEKYELNFPLLADDQLEMAKKFGVLKDGKSIERSTFLFDDEGIVQWIERPVKVEGHAERVLEAIEEVLT
jgi:peroxiredoxin Q/BCP